MKRTVSFFVAGLFLPLILYGQAAGARSSIVGQAFSRSTPPPGYPGNATFDSEVGRAAEAILVADGDTLRADMDTWGSFSFPDVNASQVTLMVVQNGQLLLERETPERLAHYDPRVFEVYKEIYKGTFDLMPGENLVYIPIEGGTYTDNTTVMTRKGDAWVYRYPDNKGGAAGRLIERLIGLPGVEYDKRRGTISISGDAVHKTFVDGAYVFWLDPDAK